MQRTFSLLLIASVLAHATFGCCLHHAHAEEQVRCEADHQHGAGSVTGHSQIGHSHEHHAANLSETASPDMRLFAELSPCQQPHPCDDAKCSFARTECSTPNVDLTPVDFYELPLLSESTLRLAVVQNRQANFTESSVVSLTLRRHLVLSVLVI